MSDLAMTTGELDVLAERLAVKLAAVPAPSIKTITFGELFDLYCERHVRTRCKESAVSNAHYWDAVHGNRWRSIQVHAIKRVDVQVWCDALAVNSPSSAKRAVDVMQAVVNWGIKRELLPLIPNPCQFVDRPRLESRDRFFSPEELKRFADALADEKPIFRDLFWLALLTGARKGNLLAMEWAEIDFDLRIWTIPGRKHKNWSVQRIPLVSLAVDILERRKQNCTASRWVFPSVGTDSHLKEPKRAWKRVLERAGLSDLRIHDLRRTMGSYLAINGESQYVIGSLLGHKDSRATAVYARMNLQPARTAAESISDKYQMICAIEAEPREVQKRIPVASQNGEDTAAIEARIIAVVRAAGARSKSDLLRAWKSGKVNARKLDEVLKKLLDQNVLRLEYTDSGLCLYLPGNAPAPAFLSPRQMSVLECIVKGMSNFEIAEQLGLTVNTVKPCVRVILSKLGTESRIEAAAIALERGLCRYVPGDTPAAKQISTEVFEAPNLGSIEAPTASRLTAVRVAEARSKPGLLPTSMNSPGASIVLSHTQTSVLECMIKGMPNPEIARRLGLAASTVAGSVRMILRKLGAASRQEASHIALERGLLTVP